MKLNKYHPFAFIYFFVNAVGLPFGLLYTIFLTPLFYVWLVIKGKRQVLLKFFIFATPFIIAHFVLGVDPFQYVRSLVLFFTVYIFCYSFYTLITTYNGLEDIFYKILVINFFLTIIALFFAFSPSRSLFWERGHWSSIAAYANNEDWPRLTMFTYEASYYSTLLVPIFAFYFIKLILGQIEKKAGLIVLMITLPLALSLSLGVIGGLLLSSTILICINFGRFLTRKRLLYSFCAILIISSLTFIILLIFYRDNPLFARVIAFVTGNDQSGRGRTSEAFYLAYTIADLKSIWWGIGPGQLKIIGDSVIRSFYHYPKSITQVSIPNALAETLVLFGLFGCFLRLFTVIYLFYKTRVLNNYFRTFLFFYIFIYQFTGSFTTNIAEYVIWILAFTNVFPQFDKHPKANLLDKK